METRDAERFAAWRAGDARAGQLLVQKHFPLVRRFFMTKVPPAEAEDLIQTTFTSCLEAADRFRDDAGFKPFLMGVARYTLLRFFDAKRRLGRFDPLTHSVMDSNTGAPVVVERDERRRSLHLVLRTLPLDDQIAIELSYWEGLGHEQVAAVLSVSPTAIKSRIFRARKALADALGAIEAGQIPVESTLDSLDSWRTRVRQQGIDRPA